MVAMDDGEFSMTASVFEPIGHVETTHNDLERMPSQASESEGTARVVIDERFVDGLLGVATRTYGWSPGSTTSATIARCSSCPAQPKRRASCEACSPHARRSVRTQSDSVSFACSVSTATS